VLTVLVVEDEFGVADVVVSALEDEGYRVLIAANGRQGMERLADTKPDLMIVDFMMPLMDGAAMCKAVRENAAWRDIPIVMTSAVSEATLKERFADFQAFLRKPFRIQELLDTVQALIGK
jgi:CheY-like chemotaxis protein